MAASKEQLQQEIAQLKQKVGIALEHEAQRTLATGKSFDARHFFAGEDLDHKYPAGPAYPALPEPMTLWNLTKGIGMRDYFLAAGASAFLYTVGLRRAHRLGMPNLSGHKLGLILIVPGLTIAYIGALKKSAFRHMGYHDNGLPSIYPNYDRGEAPHYIAHQVPHNRRESITFIVDKADPKTPFGRVQLEAETSAEGKALQASVAAQLRGEVASETKLV